MKKHQKTSKTRVHFPDWVNNPTTIAAIRWRAVEIGTFAEKDRKQVYEHFPEYVNVVPSVSYPEHGIELEEGTPEFEALEARLARMARTERVVK